jgi:peptidoglycan-associated lipoprotein
MSQFKLILASFLVVLLAGCSSPTVPDPDPSETGYAEAGDGADTDSYERDGLGEGEFVDFDPSGGELASILYFEFDSSELLAEDTETVTRHARQLAENASLKIRLEGHADERGSREYNIGLGERRSQTVRRMLLIQGASASQISTVSFGEERPAEFGSTEDAYSQNRRVEINYTN